MKKRLERVKEKIFGTPCEKAWRAILRNVSAPLYSKSHATISPQLGHVYYDGLYEQIVAEHYNPWDGTISSGNVST